MRMPGKPLRSTPGTEVVNLLFAFRFAFLLWWWCWLWLWRLCCLVVRMALAQEPIQERAAHEDE